MATERLSMRKIREILRQKWALGRSHRDVAASLCGEPRRRLRRRAARPTMPASTGARPSSSDEALEIRLYGALPSDRHRSLPDPATLHTELKRKGVTLSCCTSSTCEQHPDGYRYTQFCEHYRRWLRDRRLSMRQVHRAGEKLFVDYSGKKPEIVDPATGEVREVELFVAVLGASNYTYAEATRTQQIADWIASHVRAFEYFGGVPAPSCPTSSRPASPARVATSPRSSAPTRRWPSTTAPRSCRRARPRRATRPRSRSRCRSPSAGSWRACATRRSSRSPRSTSASASCSKQLNGRPMRHYRASRRELVRAARSARRSSRCPRRASSTRSGRWRASTSTTTSSSPATTTPCRSRCATSSSSCATPRPRSRSSITGSASPSHVRSALRGRHTTVAEHMPKATRHTRVDALAHHRAGPTPSARRRARWSRRSSPIVRIPSRATAPASASCGSPSATATPRLEAACARAVAVGARSYRHVESILKHGLDRLPAPDASPRDDVAVAHDNLRGRDYYR